MSNEERNRLVETYKKFPDAVKVGEIYSVSSSSVYRLVRQMKDEGSADLKVGNRGRKPSLSPEDVDNMVLEEPDITIREINARLRSRIHKALDIRCDKWYDKPKHAKRVRSMDKTTKRQSYPTDLRAAFYENADV